MFHLLLLIFIVIEEFKQFTLAYGIEIAFIWV